MKICFLSNYLTHHQLPFCLEMVKWTNDNFYFIETAELTEERKRLGYQNLGEGYDFVLRIGSDIKKIREIVDNFDVVIIGSAPNALVHKRIKENKLTFRYSERIFKSRNNDILRQIKHFCINYPYRNNNLYYLLSSAYAAKDYYRCGAKQDKMLRWGYFPLTKKYLDINSMIDEKKENSILWVGRMISWKHPEIPVEIAYRLKKAGYKFSMNMIGRGEREEEIRSVIKEKQVEDKVCLLGSMPPEKVREHMEKSEILLFTSDRNEGWGAVLNEAMNSGCAVVSADVIGSVPFLIKDGKNGLTYHGSNIDDLYSKVVSLLENREKRKQIGELAYREIVDEWSAEVATERFVSVCKALLNGEMMFYENGLCSKAELM